MEDMHTSVLEGGPLLKYIDVGGILKALLYAPPMRNSSSIHERHEVLVLQEIAGSVAHLAHVRRCEQNSYTILTQSP